MVRFPFLPLLLIAAPLLAAQEKSEPKLPPGEGGKILLKRCDSCHGVDAVTGEKMSEADWRKKVDKMIDRGATVTDDEYLTLINYLTANFGVKEGGK